MMGFRNRLIVKVTTDLI